MKIPLFKPICVGFAHTCAAAMVFVFAVTSGAQTLSQDPLLTKSVSVRPNMTFIMDESGSMDWQCVYTKNTLSSFGGQKYGIAHNCLKHDQDNNIPQLSSSDLRYTSPENNKLMYDPRIYYPTGYTETGTTHPNSTASWADISNTVFKIGSNNYYARAIYIAKSATVRNSSNANTLTNINNYNTYYLINFGSRFAYRPAGNNNPNNSTTTNTWGTKSAARTDCAGTVCTYNEELQNLRNWYTYHRTRLQAAKVGVSIAFTDLPDTFRMNYASLGEITRSAMNVSKANLGQPYNYYSITPLRPVNNYNNNINPFRKWLNELTTYDSVGTPLRQSLDIIGKSYQSTSNAGPWGNTPWNPGNESANDHLSCRRSFAILTTDGQWNDGVSPIGSWSIANSSNDTDGSNGPLITHMSSTPGSPITYRYIPRTADARNVGKADKTSGTGYTNTLADVALYYWSRDLRTLPNNVTDGNPANPPFWQNLSTYSIGFGVNGTLSQAQVNTAKDGTSNWTEPAANDAKAIDDLIHAAHNGGGEFIPVSNSAEFSDALRKILLSISGETSSQAGVAASTTALQTGTNKYVPYYITGEWWGNLKSINLDAQNATETTVKWQVVATDVNGKPTGTDTIPSHGTRNVIVSTNNSNKGVEFKYVNLNPNNLIASSSTSVSDKLINTFSSEQVDFIRGDQSNEGAGNPFRERKSILGDIVNSRPAFVKNNIDTYSKYFNLPAGQGGGATYTSYKNDKIARTEGMLFVGANDGMLHGFRESNGAEEFAFIPRSVLGNLHLLTDKDYALSHRFYVDGPLKEADAYVVAPFTNGAAGSSLRWTNLLMGSTGAGAKAVFALDVTKPFNMQGKHVMWEVNHLSSGFAQLGHVLSDIETGVTPSGDWVAIFGNGYDSAAGKASLFVVNLNDGSVIRELITNNDTGNGLGGVRLVHNANAQVIGAYAGDLKGNVWRFDLSGNSSSDWKNGELLFTAQDANNLAQPITAAPAVFARIDGKPGYIVVVGTGRLLTASDADVTTTPTTQSTYGLWDESPFGSVATISTISGRAALAQSTSAVDAVASGYYKVSTNPAINWATQKGWYLDLTDLVGQRNVYPVNALRSTVLIDTIAPKPVTGSCTVDGAVRAVTYALNPYTGMCNASYKTLDTNNDNVIDTADTDSCAYAGLGDGLTVFLSKGPGGTETNTSDVLGGGGGGGGGPGPGPGGGPCDSYGIGSDNDPQLIALCGPEKVPGTFSRDVRQVFIRK